MTIEQKLKEAISLLQSIEKELKKGNKKKPTKALARVEVLSMQHKEYGNPLVNELIEYLQSKTITNTLDGSRLMNRRYAQILLQKFKSTKTVRAIIDCAMLDDWHKAKATNFRYIFYHAAELVASAKIKYDQSNIEQIVI